MWPLYRFDPTNLDDGKNPITLDSKAPTIDIEKYLYNEVRFKSLKLSRPETAENLLGQLRIQVARQRKTYEYMAAREY